MSAGVFWTLVIVVGGLFGVSSAVNWITTLM